MKIAAELSIPPRQFLGFCEEPEDYARAVDSGTEVLGFTSGQFSIVEVLDAIVSRMDAPRLVLSTWTAAGDDMAHVYDWFQSGRVSNARWIVDRSFQNRQKALADLLRARFGDDAIRVMRTHCKFMLLEDATHKVLVQTSANLNKNHRIENVGVSSCPVLFDAYAGLVADIFATQMPGDGFASDRHVTASFKAVAGLPQGKTKAKGKTVQNPFGVKAG